MFPHTRIISFPILTHHYPRPQAGQPGERATVGEVDDAVLWLHAAGFWGEGQVHATERRRSDGLHTIPRGRIGDTETRHTTKSYEETGKFRSVVFVGATFLSSSFVGLMQFDKHSFALSIRKKCGTVSV